MKIQPRQADNFINNLPDAVRAVLVYGPDRGLVRERVKSLSLSIVQDLNDPFNVSILTGDILESDPMKLADEANAISMMGGKRLIRINEAGDKLTVALKDYLSSPNENAVVVIEGGELGPRSSLRKLAETKENAAAIACYVEEAGDLAQFIRTVLEDSGYRIERDAQQWLAVNLQGDRGRARSEVEKLMIYMGAPCAITLEDVQNCCGEEGQITLDSFVYACAEGNTGEALSMLSRLLKEGVAFIVIIRTMQTHVRRLHQVKTGIDSGEPLEQAIKKLQPPVFFKLQDSFKRQLKNWSAESLAAALNRLAELEARCKQSDAPVDTLCAQAILAICLNNKRR